MTGQTFVGSRHQFMAMVATRGSRDVMGIWRDGKDVLPDARVVWSRGMAPYNAVARISPVVASDLVLLARNVIIADFMRSLSVLEAGADLGGLSFPFGTDLPRASQKDITERAMSLRGCVNPSTSRQINDRGEIEIAVFRETYLQEFLEPFIAGNTGPVEADEAGQDVKVRDGVGWVSWSAVRHFSNADMATFERGLGDHLYATLLALDTLRGQDIIERPLNIAIGSATRG
ncbi:hypothetical protein ACOI1H_13340 [Loktanella sp. DJP18]|uniref:hypothetical protein n=1 Tax=Loktanella sp. DJP18 TaxID=3409788 RepID=UPI003BB7774A